MKKLKGRCNERLVEELFNVLYQSIWLPQHDPRNNGPYAEFLRTAMQLAKILGRTELMCADTDELKQIRQSICRLGEQLEVLVASKVISRAQAAEVCRLMERISAETNAMAVRR